MLGKFDLPKGWTRIKPMAPFQLAFMKFNGLVVIVEEARYDGDVWRHVSFSHRAKLPSWKELRQVKDIFIGTDRKAIQVLPTEAEYVNIHPNTLHLWCNMDRDPLPDFTMGSGSI